MTVPFGPWFVSLETEILGESGDSTQTLANKRQERKTADGRSLGAIHVLVDWLARYPQ